MINKKGDEIMLRSGISGLIGACLLLLGGSIATASAPVAEQEGRLSVSGTGTVMAAPDMARISAGVVTQDVSAQRALAQNSAAMSLLFRALKARGIADKDLQTSGFSVAPQYNPAKSISRGAPAIRGYRVSNQIGVNLRNLDALGAVLDTLVQQGANRINTVGFSVSEPRPLMDLARQMAVDDAKRKAALYAKSAGVELDKIITIRESGGFVQPGARYAMSAMAVSDAVPIARGEQALRVEVFISWKLR